MSEIIFKNTDIWCKWKVMLPTGILKKHLIPDSLPTSLSFKGRKAKHSHPQKSCSSFESLTLLAECSRALLLIGLSLWHCLPEGPWASPVLLLGLISLSVKLPRVSSSGILWFISTRGDGVALVSDLTGKTCQISRPPYLHGLHLHLHSFTWTTPEFLGQRPSLIKCPITSQWAHTL